MVRGRFAPSKPFTFSGPHVVTAVTALALAALAVAFGARTAAAQADGARFFGVVMVDAQTPPVGAVVVASVGGVECARTEVRLDGAFALALPATPSRPVCGEAGRTVAFTINGLPARETAILRPESVQPLDLTASTEAAIEPKLPADAPAAVAGALAVPTQPDPRQDTTATVYNAAPVAPPAPAPVAIPVVPQDRILTVITAAPRMVERVSITTGANPAAGELGQGVTGILELCIDDGYQASEVNVAIDGGNNMVFINGTPQCRRIQVTNARWVSMQNLNGRTARSLQVRLIPLP
jgi:hypothetical protein